jgi:hypothetical protein
MKRYHREICFPDWSQQSLEEFVGGIYSKGPVVCSLHAVENILRDCTEYGRRLFTFLLKSIRKTSFEVGNIFEFYSVDRKVKKACFRFSFEDFPVDLVLVISADGTIITSYTTNHGDNHSTLDTSLYERR